MPAAFLNSGRSRSRYPDDPVMVVVDMVSILSSEIAPVKKELINRKVPIIIGTASFNFLLLFSQIIWKQHLTAQ